MTKETPVTISALSPAGPALRSAAAAVLALGLTLGQPDLANARGAPESFADLAEQVSPSVVNITTATVVEQATGPGPEMPEGSPLDDFFRDFMDRNGPGQRRPRRSSALGSGFVISEDGYIVTNNHVIEQADTITIEFFSGQELDAEVVGTDPNTDLALLKVDAAEPLPFVPWGNSDDARVGDW
ncbi:MAG: trypsin-like peptidase domain-containing protein, partial [Pseudomonadota bacterium]